jgi:glutathione S-transferase
MQVPEIVLHQWCISPFCTKIRKVLAFKGLPYRIEEYGGLRGMKPKGLSAIGKLPVLDYGELRLQDSSQIALALDTHHPSPPLVPASVDRHLVHLLEDWADESLYWYQIWLRMFDDEALDRAVAAACAGRPSYERPLFKAGMSRYRRWCKAQGLGRYPAEQVLSNFQTHLDALEGRLQRDLWLCGDAPSIADIAVAAQLDEVVRTSRHADQIHERARLNAWRMRCQFEGGEGRAVASVRGAELGPL